MSGLQVLKQRARKGEIGLADAGANPLSPKEAQAAYNAYQLAESRRYEPVVRKTSSSRSRRDHSQRRAIAVRMESKPIGRFARKVALLAVLLVAALLVAPAPAWADPGDLTPAPDGTEHLVVCDHWAHAPFWSSGDTMSGYAYWECSDVLDVHVFCARTQAWNPVDKAWYFNNFTSGCTSSTAARGRVQAFGVCVGYGPSNWVQKYRIFFDHTVFMATGSAAQGWARLSASPVNWPAA